MANFEPVVEFLLWQEDDHRTPGKIVNLGDNAGLTRLGITSKNYGTVMEGSFWTDKVNFKTAILLAKHFYENQYWYHIQGDRISSDEMAAVLLSAAVNIGTAIAVKLLQGVLGVSQDGILGLVTVNELNQKDAVAPFRAAWLNHYHKIVDANPNDQRFLAGWENRVNTPYPNSQVPNIYV